MNKKELLGLLLAFALLIGAGVISNITKADEPVQTEESTGGFFESLESYLSGGYYTFNFPTDDFIAYVDVSGTISETLSYDSYYDHEFLLAYIDELIYCESNRAIFLYVDSPGGTVYASDELYLALENYKAQTGRPIYCYFGSQACSGGYYIAMAADEIYANRNCWTGSIGVVIQLYDMTGLYDKLGVKEIDIVSGANKTMGSSGQELTEEQSAILQGLVDESYDQFVSIVSDGRDMEEARVREIADGRIYSAQGALDLGLIDGICGYDDYTYSVSEALNAVYYQPPVQAGSWFASMFSMISDIGGKSDSEALIDFASDTKNGVWYYAETLG